MEAQISPILGMMLLQLFEQLYIMAAVGPIIVASVIGFTFWLQRNKQNKIDSARLVLEVDKVARTKWYRKVVLLMYNQTIDLDKQHHEDLFTRFLNHSNFVCKLYADKLISESHMDTSYGGLTPLIDTNENTREYVERNKELLDDLYQYMNVSRNQ